MSKTIVKLAQLHKSFGSVNALNGIDLELKEGEVLGLFGHNGAGKSTLMKLILGLFAPTKGSLQVLGHDPMAPDAAKARQQIGYLPENVSFYDQLTGKEVLTYFARLKQINESRVTTLLDEVGLKEAMNRKVKTYSKGMRQRLGLAQAMLGSPKLLLLDEPTVGLDPIATHEFYQSVDKLKQQGCAVILCSHVLPGVERHISKLMIVSKGKTLAAGTISELRQQANLPITVKTSGVSDEQFEQLELVDFIVRKDNHSADLSIEHNMQRAILDKVAPLTSLNHFEMTHASLENLYLHYLTQTDSLPTLEEVS